MSSEQRPWSPPYPLAFTPPDVTEPVLLVIGEVLHLVYVAGKTLYHARLPLTGSAAEWLPPVAFASGEAPALAATSDGRLHCAFTNWFLGNSEVYCAAWDGARWTLPQVVSRTSGVSTAPALAAGPDGCLYAVWADTTPGRTTIYYGQQRDIAWTNEPVPNGAGSCPSLAVGPDGEIIVAWQDRLRETECFGVFCTSRAGTVWSVPQIVSGAPQHHSLSPRLAQNPQGNCHLVWQEDMGQVYAIRGAERLSGVWSSPVTVSEPGTDCRLGRLAARSGHIFQVFWSCGCELKHRARPTQSRAFWWRAETIYADCHGTSDLAAALGSEGSTFVVWTTCDAGGQRQLQYASRPPVPMQGIFIPIEMGNGS